MECTGQKREDDEFDSMEHHLRDEKKDLWKQENCEL
jgi:hypothetical protein